MGQIATRGPDRGHQCSPTRACRPVMCDKNLTRLDPTSEIRTSTDPTRPTRPDPTRPDPQAFENLLTRLAGRVMTRQKFWKIRSEFLLYSVWRTKTIEAPVHPRMPACMHVHVRRKNRGPSHVICRSNPRDLPQQYITVGIWLQSIILAFSEPQSHWPIDPPLPLLGQ